MSHVYAQSFSASYHSFWVQFIQANIHFHSNDFDRFLDTFYPGLFEFQFRLSVHIKAPKKLGKTYFGFSISGKFDQQRPVEFTVNVIGAKHGNACFS